MGNFTAPFTVLRLLTPLKMTYEAAKKRAEPYPKIVGELLEMRRETVNLVNQAITEKRQTYVRKCAADGARDCASIVHQL